MAKRLKRRKTRVVGAVSLFPNDPSEPHLCAVCGRFVDRFMVLEGARFPVYVWRCSPCHAFTTSSVDSNLARLALAAVRDVLDGR